jgi:hypothetical protein
MRKIWVFSICGFGLVATAALATMVTLYFLSDDVEEYITSTTTTTTTTIATTTITTTTAATIEDDFAADFLFGAATSSYQIEGAWDEDGKSANIWDTMTHNLPEKIDDRTTGNEAADSYHLYKQDVAAIKATGVSAIKIS